MPSISISSTLGPPPSVWPFQPYTSGEPHVCCLCTQEIPPGSSVQLSRLSKPFEVAHKSCVANGPASPWEGWDAATKPNENGHVPPWPEPGNLIEALAESDAEIARVKAAVAPVVHAAIERQTEAAIESLAASVDPDDIHTRIDHCRQEIVMLAVQLCEAEDRVDELRKRLRRAAAEYKAIRETPQAAAGGEAAGSGGDDENSDDPESPPDDNPMIPKDHYSIPIEQLNLPPGLCKILREENGTETLGQLEDWAIGNDGDFSGLEKVGKKKGEKISAAVKAWNAKGGAA